MNYNEIEPNLFYNALKNLHHFGFEDTYDGCISYNQTEWLCSLIFNQDLKTEDETFHLQSIHLGLINFSFLTSVSLFQAFFTFALNKFNLRQRLGTLLWKVQVYFFCITLYLLNNCVYMIGSGFT